MRGGSSALKAYTTSKKIKLGRGAQVAVITRAHTSETEIFVFDLTKDVTPSVTALELIGQKTIGADATLPEEKALAGFQAWLKENPPFLRRVNDERIAKKIPKLILDERLTAVARQNNAIGKGHSLLVGLGAGWAVSNDPVHAAEIMLADTGVAAHLLNSEMRRIGVDTSNGSTTFYVDR